MKSFQILIADDEQAARKKIRSYLREEEGISSIIEAENGIKAAELIKGKKPDLVFLDIQMPGIDGFEVIKAVGVENMPAVIFITAFDQYALDAFEVQAVDYLLKPYDQERFKKSFIRAREQIRSKNDNVNILRKLLEKIDKSGKYLQRIMVKKGDRYYFVNTDEIMFITTYEKYIKLHTPQKTHLIRESMNRMEKGLDPLKFARIHRSTIVNFDYIKEIQPWSHGDCIVILKNNVELNLSRRYRDWLMSRF